MATIAGLAEINPPLINSSSPWASSLDDLRKLYSCESTGAVTTRTATADGFDEDPDVHQVAFHADSVSSINSFGYSPHPLKLYLQWVGTILTENPTSTKPFIISITSSYPSELAGMLEDISTFGRSLASRSNLIAIELNTSCPNIKDKPPPSYDMINLYPLLETLALHSLKCDPPLPIGIKLPPYVHSGQFADVVRLLDDLTKLGIHTFSDHNVRRHPISFLTCTNTLGSSLLFEEQVTRPSVVREEGNVYALPTTYGGMAGEAIHALSLGNVHSFSSLLASSENESLREIVVIGVGGVTSPQAAKRMLKAGARVVACATALGREGVAVFERLLSGVQAE